jgi:hypothetical protein
MVKCGSTGDAAAPTEDNGADRADTRADSSPIAFSIKTIETMATIMPVKIEDGLGN